MNKSVLCFDLGASSGRAIIGKYIDKKLILEEVHRFSTNTIEKNKDIYWDFFYLLKEIKKGIKIALDIDPNIKSIGIDTWGCDYGWLNSNGELIGNPRSYRTNIPDNIIQEVHGKISFEDHYNICGNGHFPFNSIYQIYMDINKSKILEKDAKEFLFMPNLFFYYLTGKKYWEYTIASTSGLLDAKEKTWSKKIFTRLNFPNSIKKEITFPKNISWPLKKEILKELNLNKSIDVILIPGHDSACGVIGGELKNNWGFLINGTWSLLGIENNYPITDSSGIKKAIVNEGSINGNIRFMSMILGTHILQRLKREWNIEFKDFEAMASLSSITGEININEKFINPISMERLIVSEYFNKYSIKLTSKNDILALAYNSLGYQYKQSLELIEDLSKKKIETLLLLGGGNQDNFLIETIKKYLNLPIEIGPVEASATGNALEQFKYIL